jgi:hypothetical protein
LLDRDPLCLHSIGHRVFPRPIALSFILETAVGDLAIV